MILIVDVDNVVHTDYKAGGGANPRAADIGLSRINEFRDAYKCSVIGASEGDCQWRRKLMPDYKSGREPKDELLTDQIAEFKRRCGFLVYKPEDGEADDAIATLVERNKAEERIVILSRDKDMRQLLVDGQVVILRRYNLVGELQKKRVPEWYSAATLSNPVAQNGWGIRPDQCIDFQALVGDSADKVPGAEGIGEKTAAGFLGDHDTIEDILANAKLTPKKREAIEAIMPGLAVTREVLTLQRDAKLIEDRVERHEWQLILHKNEEGPPSLICNCGHCGQRFYSRVRSSNGDDAGLLSRIEAQIKFIGYYNPEDFGADGGVTEDVS